MADKGFNGSTISIANGSQTPLRSINYNDSCAKVKVTGAGDNAHTYVNGLSDVSIDVEIVGGNGAAIGASGAIAVTWNDGTSDSLGNGIVNSRKTSGSLDGEILTTLTIVPLGTQ